MCKKIICAVLTLVLLIGLVPATAIPASAATTKGTNWTYDNVSEVLTITGSITLNGGKAPWEAVKNNISEVYFNLESGISVPAGAFTTTGYEKLNIIRVNDLSRWLNTSFGDVNPLIAGGDRHDFYVGADKITNLEIPSGNNHIKPHMFEGGKFASVTLPEGITKIGEGAFTNCPNLTSVSLPSTLTTIGQNAFAGCNKLQSISLPDSVTYVGPGAFYNCVKLSYAKLSENMTVVEQGVFQGCKDLGSITIPEKIVAIKANAFNGTSIQSINIPEKMTSVAPSAFNGAQLGMIEVPNLKTWLALDGSETLLSKAKHLKVDGAALTNLTVPEDVVELKANAFKDCKDIVTVTIPTGVRVIGEGTFENCVNLQKLVIGSTLNTIKTNAFANCVSLNTVEVAADQWSKMSIGAGSAYLTDAYDASHPTPHTPAGAPYPNATHAVSDKLLNMVIEINGSKFRDTAYETEAGSGKYLIGYGTASIKGATIDRAGAKEMLKKSDEILGIAAGNVATAFAGLTDTQLDALASYTFRNGYDWLVDSNNALNKAVAGKLTGADFVQAICGSAQPGSGEFDVRLREAQLYLKGEYNGTAANDYNYVNLAPNGGTSMGASYQIYAKKTTAAISSLYNPERVNYSFQGWYTDANGGKPVSHVDDRYNGKTLYAQWKHVDAGAERAVSYKLPGAAAEEGIVYRVAGKIKIFAKPGETGTYIRTIGATEMMDIVAEQWVSGDLWVKLSNPGWVKLDSNIKKVESALVNIVQAQQLKIYGESTLNVIKGNLHGGDMVYVVNRGAEDEVGQIWFYNTEDGEYQKGWIELKYVDFDKLPEPEPQPQPPVRRPVAIGEIVNTEKVNVRDGGSPNAKKIDEMAKGTKVNIYDYTTFIGKQWAQVDQGWICMDYIHIIQENPTVPDNEGAKPNDGNMGSEDNKIPLATAKVKQNVTLKVRTGAGTHNKTVGSLRGGSTVTIYQTKMFNGAQWGRIENGWICLTYVNLDNALVDPTPSKPDSGNSNVPAVLGYGVVANCSTHVNVRASATPHSALQGTIPLGTSVQLLEKAANGGHDWYRTTRGWICGDYVQMTDAPATPNVPGTNPGVTPNVPNATASAGTITGADDVNVRETAGVNGKLVTTLKNGSRVNIKGSTTVGTVTWYQIDQGWVAGTYVLLGGTSANGGTTETANGQYATGVIAQAGTQVRAGAGYGYKEVKTLKLGTSVTIYEQRLVDGVAWGRINGSQWVNLAFVTLNSTGVTGTGTMATIIRAGHAVNVRRDPNSDSARMATLLVGAPAEILEVKQVSATESWGRTPQGWINMYYVNLTGELPTPPLNPDGTLNPDAGKPEDNVQPETKPETKPEPVQQGVAFNIAATVNGSDVPLQLVPGKLGEYDATIANGEAVNVTRLDSVDDEIWAMVEGGWVNIKHLSLANYTVTKTVQFVWEAAQTVKAIGAKGFNETIALSELKMDSAKKVWALVDSANNGWLELTQITEPAAPSTSFSVRITMDVGTQIYEDHTISSNNVGAPLETATAAVATAMIRDFENNVWLQIASGWVKLDGKILVNESARVTGQVAACWTSSDRLAPNASVKVVDDVVTISQLDLSRNGNPMGKIADNMWIDLSAVRSNGL